MSEIQTLPTTDENVEAVKLVKSIDIEVKADAPAPVQNGDTTHTAAEVKPVEAEVHVQNGHNGDATEEVQGNTTTTTVPIVVEVQPINTEPTVVSPEIIQPITSVPEIVQPIVPVAAQRQEIEPTAVVEPNSVTENIQPPEVQPTAVVSASPIQPDIAQDKPVQNISSLPAIASPPGHIKVPAFVDEALNRIAVEEGFVHHSYELTPGSNFGDGFISDIVKATIHGVRTKNGTQEQDKLVLIVKLPPENEIRRQNMGMKVFEREVYVYNELLPAFHKFQLDRGLKPGQGFFSYPKCYFASYSQEKDEAAIIMDDIREQGFRMRSKFLSVDYPHAKTVMENLAKYHGISLAMKVQQPELFEKFKSLTDVFQNPAFNDMIKSMTKTTVDRAITTLEPHETVIKQKLLNYAENIIEITENYLNAELTEPFSVLNHGDCWINNMMFKYESGFPKHISLLDWQVVRYASPVLDLVYFIFLCTDKKTRDEHFDNLIQAYHIALRDQMERLGGDVNQIFPFTALLRQLKQNGKFALGAALLIIPMLCTDNEDLPDMDKLAEEFQKSAENGGVSADDTNEMFKVTAKIESKYKERMSGIIRDMSRKGYF